LTYQRHLKRTPCRSQHFIRRVEHLPFLHYTCILAIEQFLSLSCRQRGQAEKPPWKGSGYRFISSIEGFARFYNRRHNRLGYFWGDRFKSVIVENRQTLINCLAYIDLNPLRAGLVERPEQYRQ
jgi:hypothetical protein